jgi:hypothetical protein
VSARIFVKCGLVDLRILVRSFRPILGESSLRFCILCGLSDLALLQGGLSDLIVGVSREAYSQLALFDSEHQIRVYFFYILLTLDVFRRVNILNCCLLFYCIIKCFNFGKEPVVCHNSRGV